MPSVSFWFKLSWFLIPIIIACSLLTGFGANLNNTFQNDNIEPEYFSCLLSASSILFGFWALTFESEYRKDSSKVYSNFQKFGFIASLSFLAQSVVAIVLTALNMFSSIFALVIAVQSFGFNILLLGSLIYIKFENRQIEA